jgi:predicted DNA-binding transcriptional regulator YafY
MKYAAVFIRQFEILSLLERKGAATGEEILNHLENCAELQDFIPENKEKIMSIRTLQREINDIKTWSGIEIKFDTKLKRYKISGDSKYDEIVLRFLQQYRIMNLLRFSEKEKFSEVSFEYYYTAHELELIKKSIEAIKGRKRLEILYQRYGENEYTEIIEPLGLREFEKRWYLVANVVRKNQIRVFAYDSRIKNMSIHNHAEKFAYPKNFAVSDYFKDVYGLIRSQEKPEDVLLAFDVHQANYVKSSPWHSSQKVVYEDANVCHIALKVMPNYELERKILSQGDTVKVLKPQHLADKIQQEIQRMLEKYQK